MALDQSFSLNLTYPTVAEVIKWRKGNPYMPQLLGDKEPDKNVTNIYFLINKNK